MNREIPVADAPVALVTGGALRIGSTIVQTLHAAGYQVVIHYRHSQASAQSLTTALNTRRADSAICLPADLGELEALQRLAQQAVSHWGRLDALVNNASSFYPTPIGTVTEAQWDDLMGSNLKAPFFLAQALAPALARQQGAVVNVADIHAERPLAGHSVYCMAKAANVMMTHALARELAPAVRVNGVAPGAILWPEAGGAMAESAQQAVLERVPLGRTGEPADIAGAVLFLLRDAPYVTGQVLAVDGGRSVVS